MDELSHRDYWNGKYRDKLEGMESDGPEPATEDFPGSHPLRARFKKVIPPKILESMTTPYERYVLWEVIYSRYLPRRKGAKVLEIGSAPGHHLVELAKVFGYAPYGVEYTEEGVRLNRKVFAASGLDPDQVIHADFFDDTFHRRYAGRFDIVLSRGFVEHFADARGAVEKHLPLLADGGLLIVTVPNLRGAYNLWERFFDRELLSMHNTGIMQKEAFASLFRYQGLTTLLCEHFGAFSFFLLEAVEGTLARRILKIGRKSQLALNALYRLLFPGGSVSSPMFSPYLIYIGRWTS